MARVVSAAVVTDPHHSHYAAAREPSGHHARLASLVRNIYGQLESSVRAATHDGFATWQTEVVRSPDHANQRSF